MLHWRLQEPRHIACSEGDLSFDVSQVVDHLPELAVALSGVVNSLLLPVGARLEIHIRSDIQLSCGRVPTVS